MDGSRVIGLDCFDMVWTLSYNAVKVVREFCDSPFLSTKGSWIEELIFLFRFAVRSSWNAQELCETMIQKLENVHGAGGDAFL